MRADGYRSYVIRIRRRLGAGTGDREAEVVRLDVEDLLDGGRARLTGASAVSFADNLESLLDGSRPPHTDARKPIDERSPA